MYFYLCILILNTTVIFDVIKVFFYFPLSQERRIYGICITSSRICSFNQGGGFLCRRKFFSRPNPESAIVAMGTSAPEASVSINAALAGSNDIAISNVVGSNIFNGLVVVGVCAFLSAFKTNRDILKRDMPLNILVTFILCLMFLDGKLSRIEGGILFAGMILYIAVMIYHAIKNKSENEPEKILSLPRSIIYMIAGLAAVIFGGDLVVDKACIIATNFGVSQNFIGLTIVAIGTSLPELVTSIVATKKGDSGLALGNAIGSNLFNILFILGFSAILSPLHVLNESIIDCGILLISSILLFIFAKTKQHMSKLEGIVCIGLYLAYMGYLLI